jgi:hypothetical protein
VPTSPQLLASLRDHPHDMNVQVLAHLISFKGREAIAGVSRRQVVTELLARRRVKQRLRDYVHWLLEEVDRLETG